MYLLPDGENLTIDQAFDKFIENHLPAKDSNCDYKRLFENLSTGNLIMEKQLKKLEERNSTLLQRWQKMTSRGANQAGDDQGRYRNESVMSSNNEDQYLQEEQSLSGIEVPTKVYSKSSKNEGKILPPYSLNDKKKRYRRTANEIERHYKCPADTCKKKYGSEGSLNQHVKLKHPEIYHSSNGDKKNALAMAIAIGAQKEQEAQREMQGQLSQNKSSTSQPDIPNDP